MFDNNSTFNLFALLTNTKLNVFEQFAVETMLEEKGLDEQQIQHRKPADLGGGGGGGGGGSHDNHGNHGNSGGKGGGGYNQAHNDTPHNDGGKGGGGNHENYTQSTGPAGYTQGTKYFQSNGGPQEHCKAYKHTQDGVQSGHWNEHINSKVNDPAAHLAQYVESTKHTDTNSGGGGGGGHDNHGNHGNHGNHANNTPPEVTITNGNEIINFTYSKTGRLSPNNTNFSQYNASLYNEPYSNKQNKYDGIFVVVNMRNVNSNQWQKGVAYLKDAIGNTIATSNVYWSDNPNDPGSTIVQSYNSYKKGYAFFNKSAFANNAAISKAVIRVEVSQYNDSSCTQPTGVVTVRETVSAADSTILNVNIDTKAPISSMFRINNDALYTKNRNVTLNITASDTLAGLDKMMISNSSSFTGSSWENYLATRTGWNLTNGDGSKIVYIKFMDKAGNESIAYSDSIYLDTTGPVGSVSIANGAQYSVPNAKVTLNISATDSGSGVDRMMISNNPGFNGAAWEPFSAVKAGWSLSSGLGNKTVYIKFIDLLGNQSTVYSDSISVMPQIDTAKFYQNYYLNGDDYYTNNKDDINIKNINIFLDGDYLKFKYIFHVLQPINEKDLGIDFRFNNPNSQSGITMYDNNIDFKLQRVQNITNKGADGSYPDTLNGSQTFTDINTFTLSSMGNNSYINDKIGIDYMLAPGDYALDFDVKLKVDRSALDNTTCVINSELTLRDSNLVMPPTGSGLGLPSSSTVISTYVHKGLVPYR